MHGGGIFSGVISFIAIDYYYPGNGYRFLYVTYNFCVLTCTLGLLKLFDNSTNRLLRLGICAIFLASFAPATIVVHSFLLQSIRTNQTNNLTAYLHQKNESLEWIKNNIAYKKNILFIDGYPFKESYSPYTLGAITGYGIFTPIGPPKYKILNTELGSEWFDAITTLSPASLKILKIDYVYINSDTRQRFSAKRQDQINQSKYFSKVKELAHGSLFKVSKDFLNSTDEEITTQKISELINVGNSVFVDKFPYIEVRRGLLLNLTQENKVYGPVYSAGGDFFGHIEYIPKYTYLDDINDAINKYNVQYLALPTQKHSGLEGRYKIKAKSQFIELWERK